MKEFNYVTNNEMVFNNEADALVAAKILMNNEYVVMLSRENDLYIVNYVWSANDSDRNDVVFVSREEFKSVFL